MSFQSVMDTILPPVGSNVAHVTGDFGELRSNHPDGHPGVDFNYVGGQSGINLTHPEIHSPVNGYVAFVGGNYGTIKILDANGISHELLHTNSQSVKVGDTVSVGDVIGTMGKTGPGITAEHVHYQMKQDSQNYLNPQSSLQNMQTQDGKYLINPQTWWDQPAKTPAPPITHDFNNMRELTTSSGTHISINAATGTTLTTYINGIQVYQSGQGTGYVKQGEFVIPLSNWQVVDVDPGTNIAMISSSSNSNTVTSTYNFNNGSYVTNVTDQNGVQVYPAYTTLIDPVLGPITNTINVIPKNVSTNSSTTSIPNATDSNTAVINQIAASAPSYTVSFTLNELNGTSIYQTTIAGMTADGIRPGNMNVLPNGSLGVFPSMLGSSTAFGTTNYVPTYVGPDGQATYLPAILVSSNTASTQQNSKTNVDPLILDLNGDGVQLTSFAERTVLFDIDHDANGSKEQTGWVKAATTTGQINNMDGILVNDLNGNGKIDGIQETFSQYYNGAIGTSGSDGAKPYTNGFTALKSLDSNLDNLFTNADTAWSNVKVWVDVNADGISDSTELKTLSSLGITAISLAATNQSGLVNGGNEIRATGSFTINGQTKEAQAVDFIANPAGSTFIQDANGVKISTEAVGNGQATTAYTLTTTSGGTLNAATLGVNNLYGNNGNDTLIGDATNNWLAGGLGADNMSAGSGDDVILFDSQDTIDGGNGNDIAQVVGDQGITLNLAQSHIEAAIGGRGDDIFIGGGRGSVFIKGGEGDDIVIGGAASDVLSGEDGADQIDGGAGNDLIRGHRGRDQLLGGVGDDVMDGGQDDDNLSGGDGTDILIGGTGDDVIDGGAGTDVAQYAGSYADYRVSKINATTFRVSDLTGKEGTDTLTNVEKISFKDLNLLDIDYSAPIAVRDILDKNSSNNVFDRTNVHLIAKAQLLGNDINSTNDTLHISAISDVIGGSAIITAAGDVQFTPNSSYTGIMSFKYSVADSANHEMGVTNSSGQTATLKAAVYLRTADIPTDSLAVDQWYLSEANIISVWKDYTGKGVRIGQFEPGGFYATGPEVYDYRNPDLAPNADATWLASGAAPNPDPLWLASGLPPTTFSNHATMVAGVMVAARNGAGGVGVAYDAKLSGVYLPSDWNELLAEDPSRFYQLKNYDVVNASWAITKDTRFYQLTGVPDPHEQAVGLGRNGLGTVMIYAAGNDRVTGGNTNDWNLTNMRWTTTVGAFNAAGDLGSLVSSVKPFSNPGASILISAPGSNIESTSRLLENDNGSTFGADTTLAQGTSLAAPIVSGIVALMLEANPYLGYRDVQDILALSAKKVADTGTDWTFNKNTHWNVGGMHVSHDYGFGEVDALAAVRLAESWRTDKTYVEETSKSAQNNTGGAIPDGTGYIEKTFTLASGVSIEHVELSLTLDHGRLGDLVVELYSPGGVASGTKSILMDRTGKVPGSGATDLGLDQADPHFVTTLSTTHDWGESSGGVWTVRIYDKASGVSGTLGNMTLKAYGQSNTTGDDDYIFTNEYSTFTGTTRGSLTDSNGGYDILNAAAVTTASSINLNSGAASSIAGKSLTISGSFEAAVGGDGNDTITGNSISNDLTGGRGNDSLVGGGGADFLEGGKGNDTLTGGSEADMFVIYSDPNSIDTITDFNASLAVEKIFIVGSETVEDFTQLTLTRSTGITPNTSGADTLIGLGQGQFIVLKNVLPTSLTEQNFTFITKTTMNSPGFDLATYKQLIGERSIAFGTSAAQGPFIIPSTGSSNVNYFAQGGNDTVGHEGDRSVIDAGNGDDQIYSDIDDPNTPAVQVPGLDWVEGGSGNDYVEAGGSVDLVAGGSGNDTILGQDGNDYLRGDSGDDYLAGGNGNDVLVGGSGQDYILGEAGSDSILMDGDIGEITSSATNYYGTRLGGTGADTFRVTVTGVGASAISQAAGVIDARNLIADFEVSQAGEVIDFSDHPWILGFADLTVTSQVIAGVSLTTISASNGINTVSVNLAGVTATQINASHFKFASGPGFISGGVGNNTLNGDAGSNKLNGGLGADNMTGRAGDDVYFVDNVGDVVNELPDGGFDTINSSINRTLDNEVENLVLTGTSDLIGIGNALANRMIGNSGNNILDGKGGSDELVGGAGNDTYMVDVGTDRITENANEGISDTVNTTVSWTLGANLENLTLIGTESINATGNALVNILIGNAADNVLDGAQGADTMIGGAGDDTYFVDQTLDSVTENLDEGTDTVYASVNYTLATNFEQLVLIGGATAGTGNSLDNILIGNEKANTLSGVDGNDYLYGDTGNDTLNGGIGDDTLDGGAGLDSLIGGAGNDLYIVENTTNVITEALNEGNDTVQTDITYVLGETSNLENLVLTGALSSNATGNSLDNIIVGNVANNSLVGGAGADTLDGGNGIDSLAGGAGNDAYIVDLTSINQIQDSITELVSGGIDTIILRGGVAGISASIITLGSELENLDAKNTEAALINITGNSLANSITGNSTNNLINGGSGNDTLDGLDGADTLVGSTGNETYIVGRALNSNESILQDTIIEDDTTIGNVDTIKLGIGGSGGYDFYGLTRDNQDLIIETRTEYESFSTTFYESVRIKDQFLAVRYQVENVILGDSSQTTISNLLTNGYEYKGTILDDVLIADANTNGIYGLSGNDSITGGIKNNKIYGDDGNDTLNGEIGSDTIYGGTGNDKLNGGAGSDILSGDSGEDVYEFARGYGIDTATDISSEKSTISLLAINSTDPNLKFERLQPDINSANYSLKITIDNTDILTFNNWWTSESTNANRVVQFANNVTLNLTDIESRLSIVNATSGNDIIIGTSANNSISGGDGNDLVNGMEGNDIINGDAGGDNLYGGLGADTLNGGIGTDRLYGDDQNDQLYGGDGDDILDGGTGADYMDGGLGNNFYYVDNSGDQVLGDGLVFSSLAYYALQTSQNNRVRLLEGTATRLDGNTLNNQLEGNLNSNLIKGFAGHDYLTGGFGGDDVLQGGAGVDYITNENTTNGSQSILDGGDDPDTIFGSFNNDFIVGGKGNDTIYAASYEYDPESGSEFYTDTGSDILAFNKGDGNDLVISGNSNLATPELTISLGKDINYSDLAFSKVGDDLVFKVSSTDSITLFNWYKETLNYDLKTVINLQMIADSMVGFDTNSTNPIFNDKVEVFNFNELVANFDALNMPTNWALTNGLLSAHIDPGSDTEALGGDLAYQYGKNGNLTGIGLLAAQNVINASNFGQSGQLINNPTLWQNETVKLS